jgi:hypothetical protein
MQRLGLTLDNTLEELRRLGYARPGPAFEDDNGELLPVDQWPTYVQICTLTTRALSAIRIRIRLPCHP